MTETDAYLLDCSLRHATEVNSYEDILKDCECELGLRKPESDNDDNGNLKGESK